MARTQPELSLGASRDVNTLKYNSIYDWKRPRISEWSDNEKRGALQEMHSPNLSNQFVC